MKTTKLFKIIISTIVITSTIMCNPKKNEVKNESEKISMKRDSSFIKNYNDIGSISNLLGVINDKEAIAYYSKYVKTFNALPLPHSKFPVSFVIKKRVGEELLKKLASKDEDSIHLVFTQIDKKLNILFVDKNQKHYLITDTSTLVFLDSLKFKTMDSIFKKEIYLEMNNLKYSLVISEHTGDSKYGNTTEIIIPKSDFINYDSAKGDLLLIPGVITEEKISSTKKSKKHQLTLIMCLPQLSRNKAILQTSTLFYDDFCLKPPGC